MFRSDRTDAEFSAFVAARSHQLYRKAILLTGSPDAAEDLVQAALTKAYAAWWRVRRADDPVAYVHGIVVKTFLSERRRPADREVPMAAPVTSAAIDPDPATRVALFDALGHLSPLDRAVVVLRYWEDRSVAETADLLGLTGPGVKNRSIRALRALRGLLADPASLTAYPEEP